MKKITEKEDVLLLGSRHVSISQKEIEGLRQLKKNYVNMTTEDKLMWLFEKEKKEDKNESARPHKTSQTSARPKSSHSRREW